MNERVRPDVRSDPYRDWDAAYVLGALSVDERREYELHLGQCRACREQVSELAAMPGLLAAVPASQILAGPRAEPAVPPSVLPKLVAAARRQRRRARLVLAGATAGGTVVAAGVAASLALVLPGGIGIPVQPPVSSAAAAVVTMEKVVASPLTADIRLVGESWGTRIDSHCRYGGKSSSRYAGASQAYAMYVTNRSGHESEVATWLATPGTTVEPVATTSLKVEDISAVDIRSVATGQVLLQSDLGR
jgi:anti-sigma factor RsiW